MEQPDGSFSFFFPLPEAEPEMRKRKFIHSPHVLVLGAVEARVTR